MVLHMPLRQGLKPEGTRPARPLRGLIACDESQAGADGPPRLELRSLHYICSLDI